MGLRLAIAPTFQTEVKLSVPGSEPVPVRVTYRWMPPTKFADFVKNAADRGDLPVLQDIVDKIDGIEGDDGQPLAWSADTLKRLTETLQPAALELYAAWVKEHTQAKTKN